MTLTEINTLLVIGAILAMAVRLLAIAAYGKHGPLWLTTYLPTLVFMGLLTRRLILRVSDLLEPDDLTLTAFLIAIMVTQFMAGIVAWLPKQQQS